MEQCSICYDEKLLISKCGDYRHGVCMKCQKRIDKCPICKGQKIKRSKSVRHISDTFEYLTDLESEDHSSTESSISSDDVVEQNRSQLEYLVTFLLDRINHN